MHIAKTTKISEYQLELNNLEDATKKLAKSIELTKKAHEAYEALIEKFGTIEHLEEKKEEYKLREGVLKTQRNAVDNKSKLISDAIDVLSDQPVNNCPVCDAPISSSEILSKLEKSISISVKAEISKIDNERREIRESLRDLESHKKDISNEFEEFQELDKEKQSNLTKLQKLLNIKEADESILLKEAEARKSQIKLDLDSAKEIFEAKNSILQEIDELADSCRAIVRVLEKQAEYERIKDTFAEENSQIKQLTDQINEMSALQANLQSISETMSKVQINLAQEFIGTGQELISEYYSNLCNHPFYDSIRIDIDQRNIKGVQKNTYNIKAFNGQEGKDTLISTRFSIGQMNAAALSIFLALSSILQRKSKFLIFDDPSQSLDTEHKQFLINILQDASQSNQIIVATQDAELDDLMRTKYAPANGYVYLKYKGWSKNGPIIESSTS
jgi:DNA repair exonuclease SbcCD ATPase subunit